MNYVGVDNLIRVWAVVTILAGSVSALGVGKSVYAAPEVVIKLDVAQAQNFQQALTALSEQGHVAFVAEGVPLHPHLLLQDTAKFTLPLSLDEATARVAEAYDYTVQRQENVFVLKKRYSVLDDLPAITLAECEQTLTQIEQVTEPFNPHTPPDYAVALAPVTAHLSRDQYQLISPTIEPLISSLSAHQLTEMQKSALKISTLNPRQQESIRRMLLSFYIQRPIDDVQYELARLKQADQELMFCRGNLPGFPDVFGYDLKSLTNHSSITFHALASMSGQTEVIDPASSTGDGDHSTLLTLGLAVAGLNLTKGNPIQADVDVALRSLPVTLVGSDDVAPRQLLQALADVYGLRLSASPLSPSSLILTFLQTKPPQDMVDLPESLRQVLPDALKRAVHLEKIQMATGALQDLISAPGQVNGNGNASQQPSNIEETEAQLERAIRERKDGLGRSKQFITDLIEVNQAKNGLFAIRSAAVRRLSSSVEPRFRKNPAGVPLSSLGQAEHDAFATILLLDAIQPMIELMTQQLSDDVLHYDLYNLSGGIYGDSKHPLFRISLVQTDPDGKITKTGMGTGGLDYIKDYGKNDKK